MDSMTNGTVPEDKKVWCEFGCEVRIYYEHIEFSDGFEVLRDFETGGGIVIALGKWENKSKTVNKEWNN